MTTPDFRALCEELAEQLDSALDCTVSSDTWRYDKALIARARTALAVEAEVGVTPQVDPSDLATALNELLDDIDALVDNSKGVAGLHLNGDVAPWSELLSGGRFEEWLVSVERARAALEGHPPICPIPVAERLPQEVKE